MSQTPLNYADTATCAYLKVIHTHVVDPFYSSGISQHCFAAALLIFAGIDGLGKLLHPDERAAPGDRFKFFLPRLGTNYYPGTK